MSSTASSEVSSDTASSEQSTGAAASSAPAEEGLQMLP
jgi:hypothetical protein